MAKRTTAKAKAGRPRKQPVIMESSDDEPIESILSGSPPSRKRLRVDDDIRRPEPGVIYRPTPAPRSVIRPSTSRNVPEHGPGSERDDDSSNLVQVLMSQINALQDSNKAEMARRDTQARQDRELMLANIATIQAKVNSLAPVDNRPLPSEDNRPQLSDAEQIHRLDNHPQLSDAERNHRLSVALTRGDATPGPTHFTPGGSTQRNPPAQPTQQPQAPVPAPRPTTAYAPPSRENPFPAGQPTIDDITPAQLQAEPEPVKSLRRNTSSSDVADRLMKVVGILEDGPESRKSKSGYSKTLLKRKLAKWPSDYVFRLDDEEPYSIRPRICLGLCFHNGRSSALHPS